MVLPDNDSKMDVLNRRTIANTVTRLIKKYANRPILIVVNLITLSRFVLTILLMTTETLSTTFLYSIPSAAWQILQTGLIP